MNVFLSLAEIWLPKRIRRRKAGEVMALTARSFGVAWEMPGSGSWNELLEGYAKFGRDLVEKAAAEKRDMAAVMVCLRREAYAMGQRLRDAFRVQQRKDAFRLLRLAYRAIGIDLQAGPAGDILVSRCIFSRTYTPATCRVIAVLDEGIMAGILGEGTLEFERRMTEGHPDCRAVFRVYEDGQ